MNPFTPRSEKVPHDEKEEIPQSQRRSSSGVRLQAYPQSSWGEHLESVLLSYAALRGISGQQLVVLKYYLKGKNNKEIADACQCSGATVYKHWHRMAKKCGGSLTSDVISDFHRFLGGG